MYKVGESSESWNEEGRKTQTKKYTIKLSGVNFANVSFSVNSWVYFAFDFEYLPRILNEPGSRVAKNGKTGKPCTFPSESIFGCRLFQSLYREAKLEILQIIRQHFNE